MFEYTFHVIQNYPIQLNADAVNINSRRSETLRSVKYNANLTKRETCAFHAHA